MFVIVIEKVCKIVTQRIPYTSNQIHVFIEPPQSQSQSGSVGEFFTSYYAYSPTNSRVVNILGTVPGQTLPHQQNIQYNRL